MPILQCWRRVKETFTSSLKMMKFDGKCLTARPWHHHTLPWKKSKDFGARELPQTFWSVKVYAIEMLPHPQKSLKWPLSWESIFSIFLFKYEFYQWISLTINSAYGHAPQVRIIPASITNHLTSFYLPGKGYWKRNFCITSSVRQSVGWPLGWLVGLSVFHTKSAGSCRPCFYLSTC